MSVAFRGLTAKLQVGRGARGVGGDGRGDVGVCVENVFWKVLDYKLKNKRRGEKLVKQRETKRGEVGVSVRRDCVLEGALLRAKKIKGKK